MDMARMSEICDYYSEELDRAVDSVQVVDVLDKMEVVLSEMAELVSKDEDTVHGLAMAADAYRLVAAGCRRKAGLYEIRAKACMDTAAEMLEEADEIDENPGWVRVAGGYWVREGSAEADMGFKAVEASENPGCVLGCGCYRVREGSAEADEAFKEAAARQRVRASREDFCKGRHGLNQGF